VHDNACLEAVIDLPEIMVLKIRTNEISVSTKILFKCLRNLKKLKDLNLPKTNDPPLVEYLRWSNILIKISLVIYLFVTFMSVESTHEQSLVTEASVVFFPMNMLKTVFYSWLCLVMGKWSCPLIAMIHIL
jgi:hypothetical protein